MTSIKISNNLVIFNDENNIKIFLIIIQGWLRKKEEYIFIILGDDSMLNNLKCVMIDECFRDCIYKFAHNSSYNLNNGC